MLDKDEIIDWLDKYNIVGYAINEDLSVDVDGNVDLTGSSLVNIPVKFGHVSGYFGCGKNRLKSLEGCPVSVGGGFFCGSNCLVSLKGCPVEIGGVFDCGNNKLISLEGCPVRVGGKFSCLDNELVDSELFLYGCTPEQVVQYYNSKNLNERLLSGLSEEFGVGIKKKKI